MAIVVVQWADVMICKTRANSIVQQGMFNWVLNTGMMFEVGGIRGLRLLDVLQVALAAVLCYSVVTTVAMKMYPLKLVWSVDLLIDWRID